MFDLLARKTGRVRGRNCAQNRNARANAVYNTRMSEGKKSANSALRHVPSVDQLLRTEVARELTVSISCADPHKELEVVKSLYTSLLEAKQKCGEPTEGFSFPKFHRLVAQKADTLKEKTGCDSVTFSVALNEGHVSFKAKADGK